MTAPQVPVPVPAAPAAPVAGAPAPAPPTDATSPAPEGGAGQSATDAAGMDEVAWQIAAEADAKYSIVAEPGGGGEQVQAQEQVQASTPVPATGQTAG